MTKVHFYAVLVSIFSIFSCQNENFDEYVVAPLEFTQDGSITFDFNTNPKIDSTIQAGLTIFSKPGKIQDNAKCVNCHNPDAFDLAFFDFKREDIIRRAIPHVEENEAIAIANMIEATRTKYKIDSPKDPRQHRLFQPGNAVIEGSNRTERDYNFLKNELCKWAPTLCNQEINSVEKAILVRDEIAAINLSEMKVGIPLPLWASDHFHGQEFGNVDEWMPNMPCLDQDPIIEDYRQNYVEYPSRQNIKLLVTAIENYTDCDQSQVNGNRGVSGKRVAINKFTAGLIAMHIQREEIFGIPKSSDGDFQIAWWEEEKPKGDRRFRLSVPTNKIWGIGDIGRKPRPDMSLRTGRYQLHSAQDFLETAGFSQFTLDGQVNGESDFYMQNDLQTSWFWLNGCGFDSKRHTGYSRLAISRSGYPGHALIKSYFDTFKDTFGAFSYSTSSVFHPRGYVFNGDLKKYAENYQAPAGWSALYDDIQTKLAWTMLYVTKAWLDNPNNRDIGKNDDLRGMARVTNFLWRKKGFEEAYEWYYSYGEKVAVHLSNRFHKPGDIKGYLDWVLDDPFTGGPGILGDGHGGHHQTADAGNNEDNETDDYTWDLSQ